jgi:hypothetical protein
MTDINTLLTELVVIADTLDNRKMIDVAADLDAAIVILSSEDAQPLNKSLASLAREHYAAVEDQDIPMEAMEASAVQSVKDIADLTGKILNMEPKLRVAVLRSLVNSMRSVLAPGQTLTEDSVSKGAELLADAERKLSQEDGLQSIGYRLGILRSDLENSNG